MLQPGFRTSRVIRPALLLGAAACLVVPFALAQNSPDPNTQPGQGQPHSQTKTPDAQVEANVIKALAGAPDLANQSITTTTTYGVVTLSGSVGTEALRTEAENIASRTAGVQKVVDELTLGSAVAQSNPPQGSPLPPRPSSDNPADVNMAAVPQGSPDSNNTAPGQQQASRPMSSGPSYGPGAPEYRQPYGGQQQQEQYPGQQAQQQPYPEQQPYPQQTQQYPQGQSYPQQQPYPQQYRGRRYPQQQQPPYPQQSQRYPQQGQQPYPQQGQQPYPQQGAYNSAPYGGQQPGQMVTIPPGATVRIRINEPLDSGRTQPGTTFDGTVLSDVVADGAIAIPRGASVQGVVVDAKKSGVLAGRGEMSLQLTHVTLGGQVYPITSDIWAHNGGDKTIQTVNSTAVGAGIGAVLGAVAGGGAGAAIGAGVGGGLGLGSSAASGRGQVYIPAEGLLTFHLTQPTTVATLGQPELERLSHGTPGGPGAPPPMRRRVIYPGPYPYAYPYPYPYYGPVYYRGYYRPYRY
jgi:hypothetical protein